jgi:Fe-S-cluster containining protein
MTVPDRNSELAAWVATAAARDEVCQAVEDLYARVHQEIEQRRPLCSMSGRCCRFEEYGHRLYVTTIELAAFVRRMRDEGRERPNGDEATRNGCPFQLGKLCGVHAWRPFGCRIFFCDPSAERWQNEHYERFHAELKRLHETFDAPYCYVEWRQALRALGLMQ